MSENETAESEEDYRPPGPTRLICDAGKVIFEQGAPAHQAFYVEEGRLEVVVTEEGRQIKIAEIGPGEIFGEMGVLENEARMATIRSLEPSTVTIISRKELEARLEKVGDPIIQSIITGLLKRLRDANREQVRHQLELAAFQGRMAGFVDSMHHGIDPARRAAFREEILPLLDQLEEKLRKYRS